MLGRYVAGTLLILGAAMLIAPDSPDRETSEVTRLETSPTALEATNSDRLRTAVTDTVVLAAAASPSPAAAARPAAAPPALKGGIEEAVVAALNLDLAEGGALPDNTPEETARSPAPIRVLATAGADAAIAPGDTELDRLALASVSSRTGSIFLDSMTASAAATETPRPAAATPAMLYVTGTRVNVRAGPSIQYRIVGSVVYGQPVELLGDENDGWVEVELEDQRTGYMSRRFLAAAPNGG